jgi:uncharacterized SAM-binding protein YcdF (DUF218 family)
VASTDVPPHARGERFRLAGLVLGALLGLFALPLGLPTVVSGWDDSWVLVPLLALCGALVWPFSAGRKSLSTAAAVSATLWCGVVFTPFAGWFATGLCRKDPARPADAVFVFSSRIQGGGGLTTAALSRLLHGLELLSEGFAPRLVLSELRRPGPSHTAAARRLMDHLGIKKEILTIGPVENTHDEAVALAALARARGWRRILAVTSPLHSRRACAVVEANGLEVVCSPAAETGFDLETLDREDERMAAFRASLHERLGLLGYSWKGWLARPSQ